MLLKCKCGYEWFCKSQLEFVNCPSCLKKVKNVRTDKRDNIAD